MKLSHAFLFGSCLVALSTMSHAAVQVISDHEANGTAEFKFKTVAQPSKNDAATDAKFTLVSGRKDPNGGGLEKLHDGRVPAEEDEPGQNFFFSAGTDGGRIVIELTNTIEIKEINTYSWHGNTRGPQVYTLYASAGTETGFNAECKRDEDPEKSGWKKITTVNTNPKDGTAGGQYAVSIKDSDGIIGKYRYLLFDIHQTETTDAFGNTFFSEIDVVDRNGPAPEFVKTLPTTTWKETIEFENGKYQVTIDASQTPDLTNWVKQEVIPMVKEWYPKMVAYLDSTNFTAPSKFTITFFDGMKGVADTSGTRIRCAGKFFRDNLKGESKGALFHEMIHVIQQYGRGPRPTGEFMRAPTWLTEGITDCIRFYQFEPQTKGAEISKRRVAQVKYSDSYRVTANFLNWASGKYNKDLVKELNAAIRAGKYGESTWKKATGHTMQELGDEWKKELQEKAG